VTKTSDRLIESAAKLRDACGAMRFADPVRHVYNPLEYAWAPHERYLKRFGATRKRVLLLGMNPGPWGMAQTGVPFGEVSLVREWMRIEEAVARPTDEHAKRPVLGFASTRSEVSGRRLWGAIAERWPDPKPFFREHLVVNYCPLIFLEDSGRNRTPDKLPKAEREPLDAACDQHLDEIIDVLRPQWLLGVGAFAKKRLEHAQARLGTDAHVGALLHPSPASPKANKDWLGTARAELKALGAPSFLG
jgi:single-strand selective monofunctional uracil DNA glycosylase